MTSERTFTDHLGRVVNLPAAPQRIISLCPSQTETLMALGVGQRLVGRTRFCIHPKRELVSVKNVGGTKMVDFERIRALKPDLLIGEKEENTAAMIDALANEWPVYVTDVRDVDSARRMVLDLGQITGTEEMALTVVAKVDASFAGIRPFKKPVSCLYLIWKDPWMVVGADTFIDSVLEKCGFHNLGRDLVGRYPVVTEEIFKEKMPEMVLLSSEPFPFSETHIAELQDIMPKSVVRLVDGEKFSWYGSHMVDVEIYLNQVLQDSLACLSLHNSV